MSESKVQSAGGNEQASSSACPVDHTAYKHFLPKSNDAPSESQCPVDHSNYKHFLPSSPTATPQSALDNACSSERLDDRNQMPAVPDQTSAPDQRIPLSTDRQHSTIPKSSSNSEKEGVWIYPSEQMFFNAMRRKNWNPREEDMGVVVPIHNAVNEMAWKKILEWEKLHQNTCGQPKLVKFQGRPKDLTPKARLLGLLGYTLPFDRHDWTVDRCGKQVTYVIDFYAGKQDPNRPQNVSFYLDVRPALSLSGMVDHARMLFSQWTAKSSQNQ
ncbi:uncharacterized protein VTP21DRAFT_544 [Calcarisporiella thermophila]|uniref:uncharacterized protein n=1 Tax=Calcarisporiella thermophila TaxID=911321 RepID=UPI00374334AC